MSHDHESRIKRLEALVAVRVDTPATPIPWERWYLDLREAIGGPAFPEPHSRAVRHARWLNEGKATLATRDDEIAQLKEEVVYFRELSVDTHNNDVKAIQDYVAERVAEEREACAAKVDAARSWIGSAMTVTEAANRLGDVSRSIRARTKPALSKEDWNDIANGRDVIRDIEPENAPVDPSNFAGTVGDLVRLRNNYSSRSNRLRGHIGMITEVHDRGAVAPLYCVYSIDGSRYLGRFIAEDIEAIAAGGAK